MEVRFFKKSERQLMLDSIDKLWAHNHVYVRKPEVLEHLVLNTPYRADFAGEDNYSYIGMWDDEGEVVGLMGEIPQEMNCFGKTYQSSTHSTWIVNKEKHHHIDGLDFYDFVDQKPHGMKVVIGLSDFAYQIDKAMGWYTIKDMPRWIAVNKKQETLDVLLPPDAGVSAYLPQLQQVPLQSEHYHITVDDFDPVKWDTFYQERFAPISIGTKRDAKFLNWRYLQSPILKYHFLTVEDETGVHGLAVIRIESIMNGRYKIGRILEFIAVEADPSVLLANAVASYDPDVLMWDFYCMSDITAFGLEAVGFRRLPEWMDKVMMPTRFQPVDHECLKLNAAVWVSEKLRDKLTPIHTQQWYLTKGDADQDRAN